jgi:hypothetical protein
MPTSPKGKPLLLLDVDGPLNPFAARRFLLPRLRGYATHRVLPDGWVASRAARGIRATPLRVRLNPQHGAVLLGLPFELVWATAWTHDANAMISPRVGLPELPVIEWPVTTMEAAQDGIHWKTRHLVAWAAGRPFAWVDDGIQDSDRAWVGENHIGAALLHHVDPRIGLTEQDFTILRDWAAAAE